MAWWEKTGLGIRLERPAQTIGKAGTGLPRGNDTDVHCGW